MRAISICCLLLCVTLCGCASYTVTNIANGTDFDETKISQIRKGVTTADQAEALFGEPDSKEIVSPNQVMWHYEYRAVADSDLVHPFVTEVKQTTGYEKKLDLLMQDDVVLNFAYVKAPIHTEKDIPLN